MSARLGAVLLSRPDKGGVGEGWVGGLEGDPRRGRPGSQPPATNSSVPEDAKRKLSEQSKSFDCEKVYRIFMSSKLNPFKS